MVNQSINNNYCFAFGIHTVTICLVCLMIISFYYCHYMGWNLVVVMTHLSVQSLCRKAYIVMNASLLGLKADFCLSSMLPYIIYDNIIILFERWLVMTHLSVQSLCRKAYIVMNASLLGLKADFCLSSMLPFRTACLYLIESSMCLSIGIYWLEDTKARYFYLL